MLGYLILILKAHMEHGGDGWIGYDRRFQMTAAGNPSINWATIDTTLWQLTFLEREKVYDVNIVLVFCIPLMIVNGVQNEVPLLHGLIHHQLSSHPRSSSKAGRFVVIGIIPGKQAVFVQTVTMSTFASVVPLILTFQIKGIKLFFVHTSHLRDSQEIGKKPQLKRATDYKD